VRSANVCGSPKEGKYLFEEGIAFTGHRGTAHAHLEKALRALSAAPAAYMRLITHVLPLREAAVAIQKLSESRHDSPDGLDCIKLIVEIGGHA